MPLFVHRVSGASSANSLCPQPASFPARFYLTLCEWQCCLLLRACTSHDPSTRLPVILTLFPKTPFRPFSRLAPLCIHLPFPSCSPSPHRSTLFHPTPAPLDNCCPRPFQSSLPCSSPSGFLMFIRFVSLLVSSPSSSVASSCFISHLSLSGSSSLLIVRASSLSHNLQGGPLKFAPDSSRPPPVVSSCCSSSYFSAPSVRLFLFGAYSPAFLSTTLFLLHSPSYPPNHTPSPFHTSPLVPLPHFSCFFRQANSII